ncbi:MAG: SGNH/GDSL hydrolase family protein [Candidatus Nanopelagicales bacterium]
MTWKRFVAIGDSFTEGLDDLGTNGLYVGWADRVSETLATQDEEFTYANLAIRGRRLDDILGPQLDRALEMEPDLVSIVGGGNDMLRPRWDLPTLAMKIEDSVARTRASGADVILIGFPPMSGHSNLLGLTDNRNFALRQIAGRLTEEYGCYYVDLWGEAIFRDKRVWAPDRLHMSSEGHRRVAGAVLQTLGMGDSKWRLPLPPQDGFGLVERLERDVSWLVRHASPWVNRRLKGKSSGDELLPKRETLHRVRVHKPIGN